MFWARQCLVVETMLGTAGVQHTPALYPLGACGTLPAVIIKNISILIQMLGTAVSDTPPWVIRSVSCRTGCSLESAPFAPGEYPAVVPLPRNVLLASIYLSWSFSPPCGGIHIEVTFVLSEQLSGIWYVCSFVRSSPFRQPEETLTSPLPAQPWRHLAVCVSGLEVLFFPVWEARLKLEFLSEPPLLPQRDGSVLCDRNTGLSGGRTRALPLT